jgi:hypothetical protein
MTTIDHDRGEDFTPDDTRPRRLFGVDSRNNQRMLLMEDCVSSATTEDGGVFIAQSSTEELLFLPYRHWSMLVLEVADTPRIPQPSLFDNSATPQRQDGWR